MNKYQIPNIFIKIVNPKAFFERGFTLAELLIAMAIFGLLAGFASINLLRAQSSATLTTMVETLISDAKIQQVKAMTGDTSGTAESDDYGIFFTAGEYVLFKGSAYDPEDTSAKAISLPQGVSVTSDFPNSTVVFSERSGEVAGYNANADTVTVTDGAGETKIIEFNRYGTAESVQ